MMRRLATLWTLLSLLLVCVAGCPNPTPRCQQDAECATGQRCEGNTCVAGARPDAGAEPASDASVLEPRPEPPPTQEPNPPDQTLPPEPTRPEPPPPRCIDSDNDGYCENLPDAEGKVDCNDGNNTVFPGANEVCNGEDNDCNGKVDDNLTPPACDKQEGVCKGATSECLGKSGWGGCAEPLYKKHSPDYEFTETKCDGKDNDCDGVVDEGCPCVYQMKNQGVCQNAIIDEKGVCTAPKDYDQAEVCDGKDNNCDGMVDEAFSEKDQACTTSQMGACQKGKYTACTGGKLECTGPTPITEDCNGIDDDCDGAVDNVPGGASIPLQRPCPSGNPPKQLGVSQCIDGVQLCQQGKWAACTKEVLAQQEVCDDGKDNDCDGVLSNGCTSCTPGAFVQAFGRLAGHTTTINTMVPHPKLSLIATGSDDQYVRLWDTKGKELFKWRVDGTPRQLAWRPDGDFLALITDNNKIYIWKRADGSLTRTLHFPNNVPRDIAWAPDAAGAFSLFVASNISAGWWDPQSGVLKRWLNTPNARRQRLSPDGKQIALVPFTQNTLIQVIDATNAKVLQTLTGHSSTVADFTWSPDSQSIVSGDADGMLMIWDVAKGTSTGVSLKVPPLTTFRVGAVAFRQDGKMVAAADFSGNVSLVPTGQTKPTPTPLGAKSRVSSLGFLANHTQLVTASSDTIVRVFGLSDQKQVSALPGNTPIINDMAADPQGNEIIAGTSTGDIWIWDAKQNTVNTVVPTQSFPTFAVSYLLTKGTSRYYGVASRDGTIRIVDQTGALQDTLKTLSLGTFGGFVYAEQSGVMAAGGDQDISLWSLTTTGAAPKIDTASQSILRGHTASINALATNGTLLASASSDTTVRLWELTTKKTTFTLKGHTDKVLDVEFAPSGVALLASASADKTVRLWNPSTGALVRSISLGEVAVDLSFDPSGKVLAVVSLAPSSVYLFEVSTGKQLNTYKLLQSYDVLFHPTLPYLLVGQSTSVSLFTCQ